MRSHTSSSFVSTLSHFRPHNCSGIQLPPLLEERHVPFSPDQTEKEMERRCFAIFCESAQCCQRWKKTSLALPSLSGLSTSPPEDPSPEVSSRTQATRGNNHSYPGLTAVASFFFFIGEENLISRVSCAPTTSGNHQLQTQTMQRMGTKRNSQTTGRRRFPAFTVGC